MTDHITIILGGVAVAAVVGVVAYKIIQKTNENKSSDKSKILVDCFGEPMSTDEFTFSEAKEWILSRKELLNSSTKATILKVNDNTLGQLGKDLNIGFEIPNMLVIAIVNQERNEIIDSVLIQYRILDTNLENTLAKGNGVLVVEG